MKYRMRQGLLLLFAALALALANAGLCEGVNANGMVNKAAAVDPIGADEGFSAVLYNNINGLPTSEANAIAETSDGFIWVGSYSGLIQYDGSAFTRIESTTGITSVRSLFVDSRDRLWIGSNDAGVFLLSRGELRHWDKSDGLASLSVRSITEAEDGTIYIAGTMGVGVIDASLRFTPIQDERLTGMTVTDFRRGSDGLMYGEIGRAHV